MLYIHAHLNSHSKLAIILIKVYFTLLYIRTSKLMALNSIRELRSFFVTYAPYLEFVLFLSHKTRQTVSFCKMFAIDFAISSNNFQPVVCPAHRHSAGRWRNARHDTIVCPPRK